LFGYYFCIFVIIGNFAGQSPLMATLNMSPSAAKLLLSYPYDNSLAPTIDVNARTNKGSTFLGGVTSTIAQKYNEIQFLDIPSEFKSGVEWTHPAHFQYYLEQMGEVMELAQKRGAVDAVHNETTVYAPGEKEMRTVPSPIFRRCSSLPFDIGCILDKNLLSSVGGSPSWYQSSPWYIEDKKCMNFEVLKKKK
jgi:hypothetical protein